MDNSPKNKTWIREELLHLMSLSGTLAGLCITGVTLFFTVSKVLPSTTIVDDMLAISALLFLICTYIVFLALRIRKPSVVAFLESAADILFAAALTGMVATGFVMLYTVW